MSSVSGNARLALRAALLVWIAGGTWVYPRNASSQTPDALYRTGYAAYNRGDLAAAHASFAHLVELAPKVAIAHAAYGEVLLAQGEAAAAQRQLLLAVQLDPLAAETFVALGQAWLQLGDLPQAAEAFASGVAKGAVLTPEESRAYAGALAAGGKSDQARAVLEALLLPQSGQNAMAAEDVAQVEDALGALLAQQGRMEEAESHFTAAIVADPQLASAHGHLGAALLAAQQAEAAIPELRRACELVPGNPYYAVSLGRALTASGQDMDAIPVLRRAVGLAEAADTGQKTPAAAGQPKAAIKRAQGSRTSFPKNGPATGAPAGPAESPTEEARYALALALQAGGRPAEALPLFASYTDAHPRDGAALINYALALVQTGDAKQAVTLYARALAAGPDSATLREDYGVVYLQQSDLDQALEQFRAGLALEPENPHLHYDLGLAYKLKDNLPAAIPEFERAEALDPTLPDPPYTLGVIHMQQGDFPAAATQLEQAVALRPENGAAWAVLGNVYKENNQPEKAAEALRKAIALQPEQPSNHVSLAALLAQGGDRAGAADERRQAADLSRAAVSRQRSSFALKSGQALLADGKLKEAEAQLRTAAEAAPRDAAPHLALAETLDREGRASDAALERKAAAALATAPEGKNAVR